MTARQAAGPNLASEADAVYAPVRGELKVHGKIASPILANR